MARVKSHIHRPRLPASLYKDVTYSQLRSFCETARLGSMSAAARSLQLSHPTIWKQIRSLERQLGKRLLESRGRTSELTDAGRVLADMARMLVTEFEGLPANFQELCSNGPRRLNVAASPRLCTIDLPPVMEEFRRRHPEVRLMVREAYETTGQDLLRSGEVDVLIGTHRYAEQSRKMLVEHCFELEPTVVMPERHPLSRRREISPDDIARYPVLNDPDGYPDDEVCAVLKKAGVFDHPDRQFNLVSAVSIRRLVKLGYGIGIVGRVLKNIKEAGLCEKSLLHRFRPVPCFAYRVRRITENNAQTGFITLLKEMLGSD